MIIDGLQCGHFDRNSFLGLQKAGVGGVVVTCGFWEGTLESLDNLGAWRDLVRENSDLVRIALCPDDINEIAGEGKVGIILGFQNTNHFSGRIRLVEIFAELGVRVVQLTYNNQNELGGSCYEVEDSGLTRFGKEVIKELNDCGVLIDCSHVGNRTTLDAIKFSEKPIAVTHANANSLYEHSRNKTDDVLKALSQSGGVIGCATYRNITGDEYCSSIESWCTMLARTVDIAGIDSVAIGTDRSHYFTDKDRTWMRQGRWTRNMDYGAGSLKAPGAVPPPDWFRNLEDMKIIPEGLATVGFNPNEINKITHENWLRLYSQTFRTNGQQV